jgi:catechol 2,3-dioxygenase-like lactoylglutathione lyase family enzyme
MATSSAINNEPVASGAKVDMKFEVIVIPVADVDRSKAFYTKLGWRLDADFPFDNGFRVVQFTPPGSACSVQFGTKITTAAPGSAQGLYLIVSHVETARKELIARGVEVSEVFHTLKPVLNSVPKATVASVGRTPVTAATFPLLRSATRMATPGCSRRSQRAYPDVDSAIWTSRR